MNSRSWNFHLDENIRSANIEILGIRTCEIPLLNTKFLTFRYECYRVKFHEKDSIFFKNLSLFLFCFRRNKLKNWSNDRCNEYSYIYFFDYILEVSEQSYELGPGSIKRKRRRNPRVTWLVKRINRKSCGFRSRGTEVTGICASICALLLLLEFLTTPQDKSGRACGNSIEFSASFQSCTCPVQRIESGNEHEKRRVFRKQEIHPIFTPEFSSKSSDHRRTKRFPSQTSGNADEIERSTNDYTGRLSLNAPPNQIYDAEISKRAATGATGVPDAHYFHTALWLTSRPTGDATQFYLDYCNFIAHCPVVLLRLWIVRRVPHRWNTSERFD